MFSEEELREAAAEYNAAMVKAVLRDYDPEQQHVFSLGYERKIRRLKRRADHPMFYRMLRTAAVLLLSLLISGGALLAVSPTARAAFVGWVKEFIAEHFVYHFEGDAASTGIKASDEPVHYRPTWLPEGYEEVFVDEDKNTSFIAYIDDAGQVLHFNYVAPPKPTDWFIKESDTISKSVTVNGNIATLLISSNPKIANVIIWTNKYNTGFYISAFLKEHELIHVAESVEKIN